MFMSFERTRTVFYLVALAAGLMGGVGDVYINRWAKNVGSLPSLALGFALCNGALALFTWLLRRGSLASTVVVFLVANTLLTLAVSQLVLAEPVSRMRWTGIFVAIVGVVMVELG
jgi:drug/metabolite transporter (DMT)-like permease